MFTFLSYKFKIMNYEFLQNGKIAKSILAVLPFCHSSNYSVLNASIGLIFDALYAGTNPAINPEKTNAMKAMMMVAHPTLGLLMKYSSRLSPIKFKVNTPIPTPTNPETTVITTLS